MSFGAQISVLKKDVIEYITSKVKEGAFRHEPGDMKIIGDKCHIIETINGTTPLTSCLLERLVMIADKIHFRPIYFPPKIVKKDPVFKIQNGVSENVELKREITRKRIDYLTLPLRKMQLDDCIIVYPDTPPDLISSRKNTVKKGLEMALKTMGITEFTYTVGATSDSGIGIWRIK